MMKRFIPLLLLTASVVNAAPTLKRSWGFAGMTGNSPDTGDNFKIQLEAPGTPRAVAAGDLLVLAVAFHNGLTATITDDKSNTWRSAISCANTGLTTPRKYQIFYAVNAAAGTSLITVGFGGLTTDLQIAVRLYYDAATSSPLDGTICTTGITPVNNIAPNIQPGAISTTIDGDLIDNQIFDEEEGDGSIGANTISGIIYGSGFIGLYGEVFFGSGAQYEVQSTHGSINPGITFSQTTHDSFASLAIAIKAGSGGAAPGSGISIIRSQMAYIVSSSGATVVPFPTSGNLVIMCNEAGTFGSSLTSVTDSNSNTYTVIAGITAGVPELYHADNATTGNNLVVTLHTTTRSGNDLVAMYDVAGAASSPLDTAATAANSSTLTAAGRGATKNSATQLNAGDALADAPSIVPSTANGLVFGSMNIGLGPSSGSSAFTYDYIPATWNSGGGDNNGFGNGDGMSHYFNPNTFTVNFGYTMANASAATWNALAAAFKAGTGDTTPPTAPSNPTATASGNQINLSWTASPDNEGVTGYLVEHCQGAGCTTFAQTATPAGTTYSHAGLLAGTTHSYRVRATDAAGNLSPYSNVSSATIPSTTTTIAYVQG